MTTVLDQYMEHDDYLREEAGTYAEAGNVTVILAALQPGTGLPVPVMAASLPEKELVGVPLPAAPCRQLMWEAASMPGCCGRWPP